MAQLRKTKNELWQEFVMDFIFANYDFEYFNPQREVYLNGTLCNRIVFPKPENGSLVSKMKLEMLVDAIKEDPVLSEKIFGPGEPEVDIVESPEEFNIIWNQIAENAYDQIDDETLNCYYKY